ncbi:MAG: ABC transporter ATP-binding protein/permease [Gemmatimonadetes bacterium]|nr:ABC transporter ATP-binding protein/permease [Gemmatimonadota bacterium]
MALYLRILRYLRPHGSHFVLAVLATFAYAGLDAVSYVLLIPFVRALFADDGADLSGAGVPADASAPMDRFLDVTVYRIVDLDGDPLAAVQGIIVLILVAFTLKNVFDFVRAWLVARVEQGVTRDIRNEVYDHLLRLDLAFFGRTRTGQIISRLTHDVEQLRSLVTKELAKLLSSSFEFVVAVVFMMAISWRLTLAAFVVIPGTMAIWGPLVRKLRRGDRRVLDLAGEVNSHIQETLSGIRLVKSAGAEELERRRFGGLTMDYFRTFVRTERWRALAGPLTELLAAVGTAVILWYGARLVVVEQTMTGELFVGFLALSLKLYAPVKYVAKFPAVVQPGLVGAERVFEFLDAPTEIRDRDGARELQGVTDEIRFDGVEFAYRSGEPVLRGIDLTVPRGSVVALVGPSGAGKTTLVDLLGRFFEVGAGRITIDGTDIRDLSVRSLRDALGIVSQETVLFHDTIRANVAYGRPDATDAEVERAARAANAHSFITAIPGGYAAVVGERGAELSGGQRQRISIARALLRDPPILVFDEATSALDTESERLVQDAIERLLEGRTVFVIAHRLSTVQRADQIVVLEEGRIVERGRHDELLRAEGLYRHLYELQFQT